MQDTKIIFMGTPEFAVPSLEILLKNNYNIISVVTAPDKPQGRGLKVEFSHIKKFALENKLQVLQPEKLKDGSFISKIEELNPDIIVVVAFRILPVEIYTLAGLGSFNLHASLLPKYRGAAPINWAVIKGEKETGVTTFFLKEKVDTGNIILQEKILIGENETAGEIHDKLSLLGSIVVLKTIDSIINKRVQLMEQDNSFASLAPKIYKENCLIDWNMNAGDIHNLIRGLSPYPCAYTRYKDKVIKIFKTEVVRNFSISDPGRIFVEKGDLVVSTKGDAVRILEIQVEGKRKMKTNEFLCGHHFCEGEKFG